MDLPISIDVHPSSPPSRLQSPEPSGTPDLRRLSSHRETSTFGYGHGMHSIGNDEASLYFTQPQVDNIETPLPPSGYKMSHSMSSSSDVDDTELDMIAVCQDSSYVNGNGLNSSSIGHEWNVQLITTSSVEQLEGRHDQAFKEASRPHLQEEPLIGGMHTKFFDLVEKMTSSQWTPPLKPSSSVSIPLKSGGSFAELQKKLEALKGQIIEERSQRQAVARQLNTLRRENEKDLQHKQKMWENKFRELQKEKYTLSTRLQKLEMESPRQKLAQGGQVHLTEEDLKRLQQEINDQESLIRGYQIENEKATERLREVQRDAKEKEQILTEQNTALASQLACLQASGGLKLSNEVAYASLTESLTLRAEILNAQAREAALILEIDKIKNEKKILENKSVDFEKIINIQKKHKEDTADASCQCIMLEYYGGEGLLSDICELKEQVKNLENHENKENFAHSDEDFQFKIGEEETELRSLQKRIERMKREYDLKIKDLKKQIEKKPVQPQDTEKPSTRRVKELEAQINDIRSFYTMKLKEVNSMKKGEGSVVADTPKRGRTPKTSMVQALKLSQKRVAILEESLKEKTAIIKHFEENLLSTVHARGVIGSEGCCIDKSSSETCKSLSLADEALPSSLNTMACKRVQSTVVHDKSGASQIQRAQIGTTENMSLSKVYSQHLRKDFDDVDQTATGTYPLQEPQKTLNSDAASFEQQAEIEMPPAVNQCRSILEPRHEAVNNKVNSVQEIAMTQSQHVSQLQVMQKKVMEMESRQKHRELEWQALLIDTKRLLNLERDTAEKKWELAMEAKKAEIERFKQELDTILQTAMEIQRAQLNISYKHGYCFQEMKEQ